ncbi:glucose-6-phosphate dehydrogenase [Candidatus Schneideria nysicola]|uniref:glucose-6-phosphate dehydrogenase n=1 Tax=Candidatus Schneideria nysicola TaxID=1081631 RepID=UPI001CAA762D|nr:glucose-6-phosphate dehydrogenase [Candidatus Schneideria nysicola]UAJ65753.1 glucose-6-phosphate dehydrogenase [Candidatus Schneideria nysicola]
MLPTVQACNLIIFGTKGDLARRKLLPALYRLEKLGSIHPATRIIGVGRAIWNRSFYCNIVREALENFLGEMIEESIWKTFSTRLYFYNLDVNEIENFHNLSKKIDKKNSITISYFAMPPNTFGTICKGLGYAGLHKEPNRIVIEKPLGTDLITSKLINNKIADFFNEKQIYRVDHYLGKESVINLLTLRFANSLFSVNWDHRTIDHIQITVAEEIGIEGRWGYFDKVGQMRDMVQSHLLQILSIIAMAPPLDLRADNIRDEKVKILRALRPINEKNILTNTIRGQYTAGLIHTEKVPGYLEEKGANKDSCTETFVSLKVNIDNWIWSGVPFYLRTGKRLPLKCSEIVIFFKNPPINFFDNFCKKLPPNKITIRLQPDEGISISILEKNVEIENMSYFKLKKIHSNITDHSRNNDAYERLLLEVMRGNQALFVRRDEVEEAWKWVDSIMQAWKVVQYIPEPYTAGSWGPNTSPEMIRRDGRYWNEMGQLTRQ